MQMFPPDTSALVLSTNNTGKLRENGVISKTINVFLRFDTFNVIKTVALDMKVINFGILKPVGCYTVVYFCHTGIQQWLFPS